METETGPLEIHVTPAQKAELERLAAGAGLSVSAFVLEKVLPESHEALDRHVRALGGGKKIAKGLSDLALHLSALDDEAFDASVAAFETADLTPLQANCAAAAVESEAWRRGRRPPDWVAGVEALREPYFGWGLRSLRPHLMRVTGAPFKRRNLYVPRLDDPRQ